MGFCGAFMAMSTTMTPATSNSKVDMAAALQMLAMAAVGDDEALLAAKSILIYFPCWHLHSKSFSNNRKSR